MTTAEANSKILKVLSSYLENNPQIRFGQALCNLGIVTYDEQNHQLVNDPYYEQPLTTLKRVQPEWLEQ